MLVLFSCVAAAHAQAIKLVNRPLNPFGSPRPAAKSTGAPLRTSLYFELTLDKPRPGDAVSTASLAVSIQPAGKKPQDALQPGGKFVNGYAGWVRPAPQMFASPNLAVYIQPPRPLDPLTTYTVTVQARSARGARMAPRGSSWTFATGDARAAKPLAFDLDLATQPVHWQGEFFSGFCKPQFANSAGALEPSYEMMARDRRQAPRAWSLQRDFWLTGMDHNTESGTWLHILPNVVRELETRRIAAITTSSQGVLLKVEDFFGHEQYGIPAGRPLSQDYKKGYEILVADGSSHARARVLAVNDDARTVLVERFAMPPKGFRVDDPTKYPKAASGKTPGLFPMGGCYLRRFAPAGTPRYYWGRVDQEWDLARKYGHRLMPNFTDAPGDVSATGQNWCPPKDYIELRQTAYDITSHTIQRYGATASLDAVWSVFNEPDLGPLFWHGTREELNRFYDYTTDGILRAFEDAGLDSARVFIGGLELGGVFVNLPGLDEFLKHCSPGGGQKSLNAAVADERLNGKRSRRVEELCLAHGGKGAPLDFISIHAYGRSAEMADKLALAKRKALAVDEAGYKDLWVCSHESTPDWNPPPDEAAADCFQGNGYYASWCADVVWRQLTQGARDPRYARGNTILTFWPWPNGAFGATCAATQVVKVDDSGDGAADRDVTIPMPVYHFLTQLGTLCADYWVLPVRQAGGHAVTGFAARGPDGELRLILYAHDPADVQARGGREFKVNLSVSGAAPSAARVTQYRFDAAHNSYLELAQRLRARKAPGVVSPAELAQLQRLSELKAEKTASVRSGKDGKLHISANLAGNGAAVIVVQGEP